MRRQFGQQIGQQAAGSGAAAAGVVGFLPDVACPGVHQHIAGAGIETPGLGGRRVFRLLCRRQHADIGDAADIEHHAGGSFVGKQRLMEGGHQRRALAAGGQVAAAEVADGKNAAQFGQQRQIGELDAVAVLRGVAHGLAVAADGGDVLRFEPLRGEQLGDGLGVQAAEFLRQQAAAVDFVVAAVLQFEQALLERVGIIDGAVRQRALPAAAVHAHQHGIDAVHAGAGHQSDIELAVLHGKGKRKKGEKKVFRLPAFTPHGAAQAA